jgi:signal transduction histidine kinase/CheY-like chemotaxis protein
LNLRQRLFSYRILLNTIFCIVSTLSFAQNTVSYIPNIQHFSTEQGLSHREVFSVFQDRDGIIWLGTRNGLNRFDGYHFKHFLGKKKGIDVRKIMKIGQDDEDWLWLMPQFGEVFFFHPRTEEIKTITERFGVDCILHNEEISSLTNLVSTSQKEVPIYFSGQPSKYIYSYHSSEGFKKYIAPSLDYQFDYVFPNKDLFAWRDVPNSQNENTRNNVILSLKSEATSEYMAKEYVNVDDTYTITSDINRRAKDLGSIRINHQTRQLWNTELDKYYRVFDAKGNLIASLDKKLSKNQTATFFDELNRTWLTTGFGFYTIDLQVNKFKFLPTPKLPYASRLSARGIVANTATMTVAFELQGISTYNFEKQVWGNTLDGAYSNRGLHLNAQKELWVTSLNEIARWENGVAERYQLDEHTDFWAILPSATFKHQFWLGSSKGLYRFNTQTKTFQAFKNKAIKDEECLIQSIIRDKNNEHWLWLCSDQGLLLFDEQKEAFIATYNLEQTEEYFLPTESVQDIHQDEKDIYWLATANSGVIRWDKNNKEYRKISIANGLPNNNIYCIYPDDFGNLWMSSDFGIIRMNKATFAIKNFLPKDGIGQTEFNRISHSETRDEAGHQRLIFGGLDGITTFFPKDFQDKNTTIKPFLALLNYQQFDGKRKEVMDKTTMVRTAQKIVLNPNDYIHQIEVGLLNYTDVDNNTYHYQLVRNGEKSDWITQKSRILQLGQLTYGKHQLTVKANTISNLKAANELVFEIIVRRPFYLTWWFVLPATASIAGTTAYWYSRRNRKLRHRQKELETVVKERTQELQHDKQIIETQAQELQEIDAIKSRFFANVSHELRTPITLIQGPIQSVLSNQDMTNRNFTLLSKAKQNTKKLLQLVNEILDLTKLDGHKLELDETPVVLYTFLRQITSNFQAVGDSQSIEFIFNYDLPHILQVKIDKPKVEKILNNLLTNAFKFTPKHGQVEIEVSDLGVKNSNTLDSSGILLSVKDNGRGIPPEDVPNVFNRFYQSSTNKKAEGGLGIGLALSMEFVKLMKGKMWVESSTDDTNHGSTFFFQFPKKEVLGMLSTEQQLLIQQEETTIIRDTNQNKTTTEIEQSISDDESLTTILLVEDNPDLRDYISLILSPYYKVITAGNGAEGLERLTDASPACQGRTGRLDGGRTLVPRLTEKTENNHQAKPPSSDEGTSVHRPPSLIISDVMMPIMDGFEFLEKVKADEQWSSLPFIMLTARAEIQTKLKALRIGVDDYLLKPFDEEELLVRIANLLANYDERQAFAQTETLDETAVILTPSISDDDQKWLITIENIILEKMNDSIFSIDYLSDVVYMNRKTFYKKLKQLTGLTPIKYIRLIRLQKAKSLLEQGKSVKEAALQVGFQKAGYFSTLFKKEFGKSPSEYFD